jgi:parallel beta-helix repeat protein
VFYATSDVSLVLEGLRITGGDTAQSGGNSYGGGMYVEYASASISGCQLYSNTAGRGGGVYLSYSPAAFEGNTITTNTATAASVNDGGGGVYLFRSSATFNGNRITANMATAADVYDGGGGVYLYESSATLDGNTVVSNITTGRGGGVHLHRSGATLSGNTVISNIASDFGGGVYLYDSDTAVLIGNRVMSNTADHDGGGLYLHNSDATLNGNTLSGNTAIFDGGGLCVVSSSGAVLRRNTIVSNTASGSGGGLYVRSSEPTLVNNVVAENVANTTGSGIYVYSDSNPRLFHTTIVDNRGGDGTGVHVSHSGSDYSTVILVNTILVSHTVGITVAADGSALLTATLWHGNTIADWGGNGDILTGTLVHNHWDSPAFVSPANGDYHITAGSAARDTGVDADVDTDMDGEPRPQGPVHDIGADEHWPCIPMAGVEITGEFTTTAGAGTVFTAAVHPPTVILPITYTWQATGQLPLTHTGGISHTAVFTWYGVGARVVTVTAVNACGPVVNRTHVITIEFTPCNALTDLYIDGPPTATVDFSTVFTATVTPSDAVQPVTYTWEATEQVSVSHSGGISDTAVFAWSVSGPQIITATAVNPCGAEASETHAISVEAPPCIGLTNVDISGPRDGYTGTLYAFTAIITPSDGSEPITYAWTPAPDGGQGTVSASYSWLTAGTKMITLTAENCGGMFAAVHTITISATPPGCPKPLSNVGITGPSSGYTGTVYGFSAVITPSDATEPVTYTWTPEPDSGQGAVSASYTWLTTGTKMITLTAENCGGTLAAVHTITISATPPGCPEPLSNVGITGPSSGYTGTFYGFSAVITPSDATEPVTYDWTPTPDGGQGTVSASYTWLTTGTKMITLTVENCGGMFAAVHTITISATPSGCPKPLREVGITGPSSGITGTVYGFSAVITPSDATEVVTYTWTPEPDSGQGTSKATYSWATTGNKTFSVEVENCGGSASDDHTIAIHGLSDEFVYLPFVLRDQ